MEIDEWLVGWREIGKYLGKSAKTAQRWARDGMPFFRDPGGRPMAQKSQINEFIRDLNQCKHDDKSWPDDGIDTALNYEDYKDKKQKEFDERLLEAKRPTRGRF